MLFINKILTTQHEPKHTFCLDFFFKIHLIPIIRYIIYAAEETPPPDSSLIMENFIQLVIFYEYCLVLENRLFLQNIFFYIFIKYNDVFKKCEIIQKKDFSKNCGDRNKNVEKNLLFVRNVCFFCHIGCIF